MGRTLTVSGSEAETGFKLFPAGDYIGQIIDIKPTKVAKTGPNAQTAANNIQFKITESGTGEGVGKKFTAFRVPDQKTFASGASAFLFFQLYKALGVVFPKKDEEFEVELPDLDDMLGEEIGFTLKIEEGTDGYNDKNVVTAFFPASDGVKVSEAVEDDEFTL